MTLNVGAKVIIEGNRTGTIRYIGQVEDRPGEWIGVDLDLALGKNDGSVSGKQYFRCKPLHGVFVHPSKAILIPPSPSDQNQKNSRKAEIQYRPQNTNQKIISSVYKVPEQHSSNVIKNELPFDIWTDTKESSVRRDQPKLFEKFQKAASKSTASTILNDNVSLPMGTPFKTQKDITQSSYSTQQNHNPPTSILRPAEELRAEIRRLYEEKIALIDQVTTLSHRLNKKEIKSIENESDDIIGSKMSTLKKNLEEKETAIEILSKEKDCLASHLAEFQTIHIEEIARLKLDNEILRHEYDSQQNNNRQKHEMGIETFNSGHRLSIIKNFEEEREILRNRVSSLQELLENKDVEYSLKEKQLTEEVRILKSKLEQLYKKEALHNIESQKHLEENEILKLTISQLNNRCSTDDYVALQSTLDERTNQLNNLMIELKNAKWELDSLRNQTDLMSDTKYHIQSEYQKREKEMCAKISEQRLKIENLTSTLNEMKVAPLNDQHSLDKSLTVDSLKKIYKLQSAYSIMRSSYEDLRSAKKREESYYLQLLEKTRKSTLKLINDNALSIENAALEDRISQYKTKLDQMNDRVQVGIRAIDKLEEYSREIENLQNQNINLKLNIEEIRTRSDFPIKETVSDIHCTTDHLAKRKRRLKSFFSIVGEDSCIRQLSTIQ